MTFMAGRPDLRNSGFSEADLVGARRLLHSILHEDDPQWLQKPVGPIAGHWNADTSHSAAFLINVAMTINALITYCTEDSVPVLREKVKSLFQATSEDVFEDRLVELEIGACVAERVSPICIEPLVNRDEDGRGEPVKSPDYGFDLSGTCVYLEVTRIRTGSSRSGIRLLVRLRPRWRSECRRQKPPVVSSLLHQWMRRRKRYES
jgi:hypothetical protein